MLMNDQPEKFFLKYDPTPCAGQDTVLAFRKGEVLLRKDTETNRFPEWKELADIWMDETPLHAFTQADRRVFILDMSAEAEIPVGFSFEPVRVFRTLRVAQDAFLLNAAYHLSEWYAKRRYCGVCGAQAHPAPAERALICDSCGYTQYPTISPAVIVAIMDADRILLARNAYGTFKHFSLIAGYVEVGETLEQAVQREIMEEVGLLVNDIRYVASQPWGFSQSLMIGFQAHLIGSPEITLQQSELAEARWFSRDELPEHASQTSIAFDLIERFHRGDLY